MNENLDKYRDEINKIDLEIVRLLSKRFKLMPKIAEEKRKMGKEVFDENREKEILNSRYNLFKSEGIDDIEFTQELFNVLMNKSKKIQKEHMDKD